MNVRNRSSRFAVCTVLTIAASACTKRGDEPGKPTSPAAPPASSTATAAAAPVAAAPPAAAVAPPAAPAAPAVAGGVTTLGLRGLRVDQPLTLAEVKRVLGNKAEISKEPRGAARRSAMWYPPMISVSFPADQKAPFLWFETFEMGTCLDHICIDAPLARIAASLDPTCTASSAIEVMTVACRVTGTSVLVVSYHWLDIPVEELPAKVPLAQVLEPVDGTVKVDGLVWLTPGASWVPEPMEEGDSA